jgi:hypothetical protein
MLLLVGGGGASAFKFKDTLKRLLFGNVIARKIFPSIEMQNVIVPPQNEIPERTSKPDIADKEDTPDEQKQIPQEFKQMSTESLAADYIMKRMEKRLSIEPPSK